MSDSQSRRTAGISARLQLPRHVSFSVPLLRSSVPPPCSRGGHTLTALSDSLLLLFGGWQREGSDESSTYYNDMKLLKLRPDATTFVWKDPPRSKGSYGSVPCARANHTLTRSGEHLILFGGCCARGASNLAPESEECSAGKFNVLADSHALKMSGSGWRWEPLAVSVGKLGEQPDARCGHSAVAVESGNKPGLIVFGGRAGDSTY
ncbi:hypothetical protein T492DRAFT_871863 [Pavlovales sp. CCMP2436]|nr:hypothetical protein T492DRAFT_871863 [Pavlovales sp. CCMP2436]